jgi:hypothetical protein
MTGAYGPWLADKVLGDGPGRLSFRTGRWKNLKTWQTAGRRHVLELIAPVNLGERPEVKVESQHTHDGRRAPVVAASRGPRTEAVFLKSAGAQGRLPAILGLHDHGGNKFMGWRKIARTDDQPLSLQKTHQERYYGGVAWANEIAKRGYAVLVHDTFPFASRRVRVSDVPEGLRQGGIDPEPSDARRTGWLHHLSHV